MQPICVRIKGTGQIIPDMVPSRAYQMIADGMAEKVVRTGVQGEPLEGNFTTSGVANVDLGPQPGEKEKEAAEAAAKKASADTGRQAHTAVRETAARPGAPQTAMLGGAVGRVTHAAREKFAEVFGNI
jgi:hypothetical protein